MFPRVLVVQMDYHKTLPTPKVTSQDWTRKLRTHLRGVYFANEDCLHCYLYDDTVAGAGPNEVISLLHCTLMKLTEHYGREHLTSSLFGQITHQVNLRATVRKYRPSSGKS